MFLSLIIACFGIKFNLWIFFFPPKEMKVEARLETDKKMSSIPDKGVFVFLFCICLC